MVSAICSLTYTSIELENIINLKINKQINLNINIIIILNHVVLKYITKIIIIIIRQISLLKYLFSFLFDENENSLKTKLSAI